jgi:hypothetical protein
MTIFKYLLIIIMKKVVIVLIILITGFPGYTQVFRSGKPSKKGTLNFGFNPEQYNDPSGLSTIPVFLNIGCGLTDNLAITGHYGFFSQSPKIDNYSGITLDYSSVQKNVIFSFSGGFHLKGKRLQELIFGYDGNILLSLPNEGKFIPYAGLDIDIDKGYLEDRLTRSKSYEFQTFVWVPIGLEYYASPSLSLIGECYLKANNNAFLILSIGLKFYFGKKKD